MHGKRKNKNKTVPIELLAARKGNRDAEFELLGPGFHQKDKVRRNLKKYSRKNQPKITTDDAT